MGKFAGGALRLITTALYLLAFFAAAVGLGIYSYFLAKLSYHDLRIDNDWRAVEGLTGAGVLYCIFAVLLTCFLGGNAFFGFLGIFLDVLFCGAFIAVSILTRHGDESCNGIVNTPLGIGNSNAQRAGTHLGFACTLNKVVFAVSIIAAFLFAIIAILQVFLVRNHQKEKRYGPSPKNNYTSGYGRFFKRKPKVTRDAYGNGVDSAEMGTATTTTAPTAHSVETGYTGTTGQTNGTYSDQSTKYDKQQQQFHPATAQYDAHSGYQTGPVDQSVNPYGYSNPTNTRPTGTAVNY